MASRDSGMASDNSNVVSAVGSYVGGAIGALAGAGVSEQGAAL